MSLKGKIKKYIEAKVRQAVLEIFEEERHNIKYGLQKLALEETCNWIQENVPINKAFEDRFDLLTESIKHIEVEDGLVLEFGVYKGETINHIANHINKNKLIYGFDSFEGLKEPWIFMNKGGFSDAAGVMPSVPENVTLVKGFFSETLPDFTSNTDAMISLLHIDSDLYSSAKTIFNELNSLIVKGTVIVFDEFFNYPNWKNGEFKAWNEFVQKHKVEFEYIGYTFQRTKYKKSGNQLAIKVLKRGV
ncbi:class I SAM-dependent methyltransferase [Hyunsoonleella rubra]|uniref:Class I SAM-dependent methyltransferase n=1 Tax=Hyunsoonleella rubra TaxID=1737062 RepID=A0ABW5TFR9_9FLAO